MGRHPRTKDKSNKNEESEHILLLSAIQKAEESQIEVTLALAVTAPNKKKSDQSEEPEKAGGGGAGLAEIFRKDPLVSTEKRVEKPKAKAKKPAGHAGPGPRSSGATREETRKEDPKAGGRKQ